jgi:hypothetical protein|tara:strand:+ start:39 stop:530 length:492 start_codon:yes stop_codon:yes gene_type:complete
MGRKRKPGERYKCGKLKRERDGPTPELEFHRAVTVAGGDPTQSTTPLDAMHERGQITQNEYNAALEYSRCHRIRYGAGYQTNREHGREPTERQMIRAREFVEAATEILLRVSREAKNAVDNVACYQRGIRTCARNGKRPRKRAFFMGVEALAKWYVRAEKKAA